jgi:hypothetical protein
MNQKKIASKNAGTDNSINNLIIKLSFSILYIFVCAFGVFISFYPTILSRFKLMQTDPGDTRLNNYFLEHSFQLFTNQNYMGDLWSPQFFYPYQQVLTFSDNLFGSAPIYWLFRLFHSSDLGFQLWMITVCILCFFSFLVLMRKYKVHPILSALGAFLFAFSMPRIAKIGHQQLLPQFFTPLAFLSGWEFFCQPTRKRLTLFLLLTYLQVLAGIYLGWFLLFSLPLLFAIACKLDPHSLSRFVAYWRRDWKAVIVICLSWLGLMLLTLLPYIKVKSVLGSRAYSDIDQMLPRLSSWFSVQPGSLWSFLLSWVSRDLPMVWEHYMFAGFTVVFLTMVTIYAIFYFKNIFTFERALLIKVCLLVFITIFCLSLRLPFGLSVWRIIYELVPGASVIRAVTRIWTIAYFYLLVAVILCFDSIFKSVLIVKLSRRLSIVIVSILCILGLSEQIVLNLAGFEKAPLAKEISEIRNLMEQDCDIAYLYLNPEKVFYVEQLSAMWAGIAANVPVVNGYSGNVPPNYGDITTSMNTSQIVNWLSDFNKDNSGNLCIISQESLEEQDIILALPTVTKNISLSEQFVSYTIPLPITKIFQQEIKVFEFPEIVASQSSINVPVILKNTSNFLWSNKSNKPTNFSYRWIDSNGNLAVFDGDGERTLLPYDMSPGDLVALNSVIKTPNIPGQYKLILTMVQEHVAWFHDQNADFLEIPVKVVAQ